MNSCNPIKLLTAAIIVMGGVLASTQVASAAAISIANASFESPALTNGETTDNTVPDWTSIVSNTCSPECYGVFNPAVGFSELPSGTVPDGNNALYMASGFANVPVTQTLAATLQAGTYMLTLNIGNPADRRDNAQFGFALGVAGSSSKYASFLSTDMSVIPNGTFAEFSASSTIPAGNIDIGRTLAILLYGPAGQGVGEPVVFFDNIRLTVVPVPLPGSGALLALGLASVRLYARRARLQILPGA